MTTKCFCVVDAQGYYDIKTNPYVQVKSEKGDFSDAQVEYYILKPEEKLIETTTPSGMIKPRWTGSEWEETASPEEIEAAKPAPPPPTPPSDIELLATEMSMAMAAMQQQTDMAIAELTVAIAAGQEVSKDV